MGAMSAPLHVVCAGAAGTDELWDLAEELRDRLGDRIAGGAPGLHGFTRAERDGGVGARYCFHPTGEPHVEFRSDELREALLAGCMYLAKLFPPEEMWRRD